MCTVRCEGDRRVNNSPPIEWGRTSKPATNSAEVGTADFLAQRGQHVERYHVFGVVLSQSVPPSTIVDAAMVNQA
jgi:hypothetical protein